MAENITRAITDQINRKGSGWIFSPKDLSRLGSSEAVHVTLHRLEKQGKIRRVRFIPGRRAMNSGKR